MTEKVSVAWAELVAYWKRRGDVLPLNQLPGLWEFDLDEKWHVKVNGHDRKIDLVPPFHAVCLYQGWPAIMMTPRGGTSLVGGDGERAEDMFIEAIKVA